MPAENGFHLLVPKQVIRVKMQHVDIVGRVDKAALFPFYLMAYRQLPQHDIGQGIDEQSRTRNALPVLFKLQIDIQATLQGTDDKAGMPAVADFCLTLKQFETQYRQFAGQVHLKKLGVAQAKLSVGFQEYF